MTPKKLNVAFQMDDINKINLYSDTTFALLIEAYKRNFNVFYYNPSSVTLDGNKVIARCQKVLTASYNEKSYISLEEEKLINLSSMDVIWLRQDPPFDMNYLTSTYFLDFLTNNNPNILVLNNATNVRKYPEKIFAHYFTQFMPKTLITKDRQIINAFLQKEKKIIIKPLFEAKGDDVLLIEENHPNKEALISYFLENYKEPVVVQQFLPKVKLGDKRVLIIDGEPLGAFVRIPTKGITSNLAKGGIAESTELNEKELEICNVVGKFLKQEGLFFAGIDLIDNHLTEINLTSPTGLMSYYNFSGNNLAITIWDKIINKLKK